MYCAPTKLTTLDKLVQYSRYLKIVSPTNSSMQKVEKQPPLASPTEFQTSQKKLHSTKHEQTYNVEGYLSKKKIKIESIWKAKVPLKVVFFTWTVALGQMLTLDNFRSCKVIVVEWCYMHKKDGDSVDHL